MEKNVSANRILLSNLFYKNLQLVYTVSKGQLNITDSFESVMKDNCSRMEFLIGVFENIDRAKLSEEVIEVFDSSIEMVVKFMSGNFRTNNITIPSKYIKDSSDSLIIPTDEDIDALLAFIRSTYEIYKAYYEDGTFYLSLPDKTFNQNMIRTFDIKKKQLAHLLGLTDSSLKEGDNNLLRNLFVEYDKIKNPSYYNEDGKYIYNEELSTRFLEFIISKDGKELIHFINSKTKQFLEKDKKFHKSDYSNDGLVKSSSIKNVSDRMFRQIGIKYPTIKYSRYFVKTINLLNFLNMENVYQMVLDYQGEGKENDVKDMFLVNGDLEINIELIRNYVNMLQAILERLIEYEKTNDIKRKYELSEWLNKHGINTREIDSTITEDDNIKRFISFYSQYNLTIKNGINPSFDKALASIRRVLESKFSPSVHMVGFESDFKKDEDRNTVESQIVPLDDENIMTTHCDTSIAVNIPLLVGKYYKLGREFFLDKICSIDGSGILRISDVIEELGSYENSLWLSEKYAVEYLELHELFEEFTKKYGEYLLKTNDYELDNPKKRK